MSESIKPEHRTSDLTGNEVVAQARKKHPTGFKRTNAIYAITSAVAALTLVTMACISEATPTQNTDIQPITQTSTEVSIPMPKYFGVEDHIKNGTDLITDENVLSDEQAQIVKSVKEKYGIEMVSPIYWDGTKNNAWDTSELQIMADTIQNLPPAYLNAKLPEYIYLIKPDGSAGSAAGDARIDGVIIFYIPSTNTHPTPKENLEKAVVHEFTHKYPGNPEIVVRFIESVGWFFDDKDKTWKNSYPSLLEYTDYSLAHAYPGEDWAETVGYAYTNPAALDQKRIEFILNEPIFDDWDAIAPLR